MNRILILIFICIFATCNHNVQSIKNIDVSFLDFHTEVSELSTEYVYCYLYAENQSTKSGGILNQKEETLTFNNFGLNKNKFENKVFFLKRLFGLSKSAFYNCDKLSIFRILRI